MATLGEQLFSLAIPAYSSPTSKSPGGTISVSRIQQTKPSPTDAKAAASTGPIYLLTFSSPPDNRLTPQFLDTFRLALSILQHSPEAYSPGILLTTSSVTKFYSNGLDYAGAIAEPGFMSKHLYPLWRKLLSFPMPTVAVLNGHAFAGGLMLAMAHDYRVMNPSRGFVCLNELEFNAPLTPAMSSVFKAKLPTFSTTFRSMVLEARRFNAQAALDAGIVDALGGVDEAVKLLMGTGVVGIMGKKKPGETSYGKIKEEMYREVIADLDLTSDQEKKMSEGRDELRKKREQDEKREVEAWIRKGGKAKL